MSVPDHFADGVNGDARHDAIADELGGDVLDHNVLEAEEEQPPAELWLSPLEHSWAVQLKEFVEAESTIKPLTDYEYAEHAIIAEGNLEQAIRRIKGMQTFREVYQPQDTVEEAVHYFREYCRQQPGNIISFDVQDTGTCICACHLAVFDPSKALATEQSWKTYMVGEYYWWKAQQPTLRSVRQGSIQLMECEGVGWHNIDLTFEKRWNEEIADHIPAKLKHIMMYNPNLVMNLAWSLVKPFMREEHRKGICMGCVFDQENPEATLMDMFCQPTPQAAAQRALENGKKYIAIRYQKCRTFRL